MSDDARFAAERRRIESERKLLGDLSKRLKEVAGEVKDKYGIEGISHSLLSEAHSFDGMIGGLSMGLAARKILHAFAEGLYAVGKGKEADSLTKEQIPGFIEHDKFLRKIGTLGGYTEEHVNLYAARTLVGAVVDFIGGKCSRQELRNKRLLCDLILDEARDLMPEGDLEPAIAGEQAALKGKILYQRALQRLRTDDGDKERIECYLKDAVVELEQAREHGNEDEEALKGLACSYRHLAELKGLRTPEGNDYAQKALDAYNRLMEVSKGALYAFNQLEAAELNMALGKPDDAVAGLILGAAEAGMAGVEWLKEESCGKIREIYAGHPEKIETALELVGKHQAGAP